MCAATLTCAPPASAFPGDGYAIARFSNVATGQCITTNPDGHLFSRDCYERGDYKYPYQQWSLRPGQLTGSWQLKNVNTGLCIEGWTEGPDGVRPSPCTGSLPQTWVIEDNKIVSAFVWSTGTKTTIYDHGASTDIRMTYGLTVTPPAYGLWNQHS
ncbi:RICIN domain-containing protein [Nonomuraea sp. NBC_01738]|uniref:RICIN domain-containing protein n=1 Tax=Nonomuraea sp. NBC_01738 TaxID=2976003 RepID=UPI003FA3C2C0